MVFIHDFGRELVYGNTSTIADSGVVSGAVTDGGYFVRVFSSSFFSWFARVAMEDSSSPHMVMRMRGSVPEGRTRRRPFRGSNFLLYSRRRFLAESELFRACFCSVVAGILRMT